VAGGVRLPSRLIGARWHNRSRRALLIAQVALSLVLLIGATLLVVSLQRLQHIDAGFNAEGLLTAVVNRFRPDGRDVFVQQLLDRVAAIPGVRSAAAVTSLPLAGGGWTKQFNAEGGSPARTIADVPNVNYFHVTPDYFAAMGAVIRQGRGFTDRDRSDAPLVAIVNETLARRTWPGENPIGKRISMFPPESLAPHLLPLADGSTTFPRLTVVGLVADFRDAALEQPARPSVFVPLAQGARAGAGDQFQAFHYIAVRTTNDPIAISEAVARAVAGQDRNAALSDVRTMASRVADSTARRRFAVILLGGFAALALILTVVGLYGVLSYSVSQQREELAVRAAVGASTGRLLRLVLADGMRIALAGTGAGLLIAIALSGTMTSLVFEIRALSPSIYLIVTSLLVAVTALACLIPAVRAASIDPARALRLER
jgi:predicted permease